MNSHDKQSRGMPIYRELMERNIAESTDEIESESWFPSNASAQKLWRCFEALRDVHEIIADCDSLKNTTKKKRRLKIAITPLHSFISAIDDLCSDLTSNQETKKGLTIEDIQSVNNIKHEFSKLLPHDHKSTISTIRNKLSSHVDKKIYPQEILEISTSITSENFGKWLHLSLHVLIDLLKLEVYHWTCKSPIPGCVVFMTNEPFVVTFKNGQDNTPSELVSLNISRKSPKTSIIEEVDRVIKSSQWMFRKNQPRIGELKDDAGHNWNTFSSSIDIYKNM